MKLILNHQSLWLPSLEIRDFDRSHQIALITINFFFFKLQLFFNEIIISYADSPHFFLQITSTNIDQGQNHVFLLIFSSSQSSLTCGCLGTRRNGWDRDVLWEELLAENYKLWVAQAFSQASVFIIIASLTGIITRIIYLSHQGEISEGTTSDFFPRGRTISIGEWAISPNIFHQHQMEQSPKCCITTVFAIANVLNLDDLFFLSWWKHFIKTNITHINRSKHTFKMHLKVPDRFNCWR